MTDFNNDTTYAENTFIKSNPEMLNNFYNSIDVFPYWVADMDFQVASSITEELNRLVKRGVYSYEFNQKAVFSAISNWYNQRHQLTLSADNFVQVPGVLSGIAMLIQEFTDKGDAVLIHTPAYHQFANLINKAERQVVTSELIQVDNEYQIDFEATEQHIKTNKIKAMIFCNPHNPTGRVWRKNELQRLVEMARRYNVLIISDEIHADIIFEGNEFTSLTRLSYDNVLTLIGSPAKTFGLHSISNGYIYSDNARLLGAIKKQVSAMYLDHGNAFSTFATIAAFEKGADWLDGLLDYLQGTVKAITDFTAEFIPQLKVFQPQGTYQVWFDFSALNFSEEQLKTIVFQQAKMGLTPGSWFDAESSQFMRMNIATSREQIICSFKLLAQSIIDFDKSAMQKNSGCGGGKKKSGCC